jgi:hypothetical protein
VLAMTDKPSSTALRRSIPLTSTSRWSTKARNSASFRGLDSFANVWTMSWLA